LAEIVQDGKKYFVSRSWDETLKILDGAEHRCERALSSSNLIRLLDTYTIDVILVRLKSGTSKQKNVSKTLKRLNGNKYLASGSYNDTIKIWDLSTYYCISTLTGHSVRIEWQPLPCKRGL